MGREEELTKYRKKYENRLVENRNYYYNLMDMVGEISKNSFDGFRYNSFMDKMEKVRQETEELLIILDNPEELLRKGKEDEIKEEEQRKKYEEMKARYESTSIMEQIKQRLSNMFKKDSSEELKEGKVR